MRTSSPENSALRLPSRPTTKVDTSTRLSPPFAPLLYDLERTSRSSTWSVRSSPTRFQTFRFVLAEIWFFFFDPASSAYPPVPPLPSLIGTSTPSFSLDRRLNATGTCAVASTNSRLMLRPLRSQSSLVSFLARSCCIRLTGAVPAPRFGAFKCDTPYQLAMAALEYVSLPSPPLAVVHVLISSSQPQSDSQAHWNFRNWIRFHYVSFEDSSRTPN